MQLDIFEHSRDVVLRNAAMDALRERDTGACAQAVATLAAEYSTDPLLPALGLLCEKLRSPTPNPISREAAIAILQETRDTIAAAAHNVFGRAAQEWLSPLWAELAAAIAKYPFDSGNESLHSAPLLLHAGRWADAAGRIESIDSWRRQPAPLAWMIEARCRLGGFDAIWPLLAELDLAGDDGECLLRLIADGRLAEGLRLAQDSAHTLPESCARVVLGLLALEHQGRHVELVENRRRLRDAHPSLFERYMQDR